MSKEVYDLLTDIAARCNIRNDKVLRKSKELISLLNSKQQVLCSDTCKAVACLEIASSLTSTPLNRDEAVKYSGCRRKNYTNIYNNISKLLNLDKIYSVKEICLLVGVSDIQESVIKLIEKFKNQSQDLDNDFEHPMYSCAAVSAFCRSNKIKINQSKILEISRIKRSELDTLVKKFQSFISVKTEGEPQKKKNKLVKMGATRTLEGDEMIPEKKKATAGVMTDKEYEEWKRKMLEE